MEPKLPRFTMPERSVLTLPAARAARTTPIRPSPAMRPEVYRTPRSTPARRSSSETFLRRSMNQRTIPPAMMPALRLKGRYIPTAKGITWTPTISTTMATPTPVRIRAQGNSAFMMPSTSIFIMVAWGAGISSPPNSQAAFIRYSTNPMTAAEAMTPMISPICCFLGVAPRMKPVFRS